MNKMDALRCELKCREMVEGTDLKWFEVVRYNFTKNLCPEDLEFFWHAETYEFALGVVEGKPVWKGDTLWHCNRKFIADETLPDYIQEMRNKNELSWNPPSPKTIMVELPIEIVEKWSTKPWSIPCPSTINNEHEVIATSCTKALDSAKCK